MKSAEVQINNEWLKWARKTAHYRLEDISKKMRVKEDTLEKWENTGKIKYANLLKLAEYYHRSPMIFFNEDNPKKDYIPPPDFRTVNSKNIDNITPDISFELRSARNRRENLLNLEDESEEYRIPYFKFPFESSETPEELAKTIKDHLKISNAKLQRKDLEYWIRKIEELGVLVFQFYGISSKEMRGYALYYNRLPIIGINHQDRPNGKKFTLFHELAHIIIKKEGISNFDNYFLVNKDEQFCNEVAAEILVPSNTLKKKVKELGFENTEWNYNKIEFLRKIFNVSSEVIIRRLLYLDFVTKEYYKLQKEEFDNYLEYNQKGSINSENQVKSVNKTELEVEVRHTPNKNSRKATIALTRNGLYYTEMVLSAYDAKLITNSTMAEYLGESLQVIQELRKKLLVEMVE